MKKLTRREWNKLSLSGLTGLLLTGTSCNDTSVKKNNNYAVLVGANSYSFRDRSLDSAVDAFRQLKIPSCELWQTHAEPAEWKELDTNDRSQRRLALPLSHYHDVREKFERIGVPIQAYSIVFNDAQSDEEIEKAFQVVQALGTNTITTTATISVMSRVDVFARKYKVDVGMHNHDKVHDSNAFSTPESFARAMKGNSDHIKINLDIGHFTAANLDPVAFILQNHHKIVCLHIKDRKRDHGPNVPFGHGDTPIKAVLTLLKEKQYNIPANIEYEYKGDDTLAEVEKCMAYCRQAIVKKTT